MKIKLSEYAKRLIAEYLERMSAEQDTRLWFIRQLYALAEQGR